MELTLRLLDSSDERAFYKALNEQWEPHFDFIHYWDSLANQNFNKYIELAPSFEKGLHIPASHVPCTMLFAFNRSNQIVGRTSIRYKLNEHLLRVGGHIGYGVCPSHRKKGYATEILAQSLSFIKNKMLDLNKVLVTCDEDNIASQKAIERNNGVLENILKSEGEASKMRYWIKL